MVLIRLVLAGFAGAGLTALFGAPFVGLYVIALMPFGASLATGLAAFWFVRRSMKDPDAQDWRGASTNVKDHPLLRAGHILSAD